MLTCEQTQASHFCFTSIRNAKQKTEDLFIPDGAMAMLFYITVD